jgi:cysteine desulfurase
MPPIYLDNAASTRVSDEVLALVTDVMRTAWGNPSSQHPQGAAARAYIDTARARLLAAVGGKQADVVWTGGCTEANALAVLGAARAADARARAADASARDGGAVVISTLEHPAISTLADRLEREGRDVRRVAPGPGGVLDPDEVAAASRGAAVVALIAVQNEIGTVQPLAAIQQAMRAAGSTAHFHVDAAQALGKIALDVGALGVDSLAIAGHKLHGPKGIGALVLREGARIEPLWVGGGQQRGLRGGTQDAPGAAGLGLAAERAVAALPTARARWLELAGRVRQILEEERVAYRQLVPDHRRAPHILALGFPRVSAGAMKNVLASRGVCISTGSACADGTSKPSHVLVAIGLPEDHGMVRLSFAHDTTLDEVDAATHILADAAKDLSSRTPAGA